MYSFRFNFKFNVVDDCCLLLFFLSFFAFLLLIGEADDGLCGLFFFLIGEVFINCIEETLDDEYVFIVNIYVQQINTRI